MLHVSVLNVCRVSVHTDVCRHALATVPEVECHLHRILKFSALKNQKQGSSDLKWRSLASIFD